MSARIRNSLRRGGIDAVNENFKQVLDYSFQALMEPQEILENEPRAVKGKLKKNRHAKYSTQTIKLNNNHLTDLSNVGTVLEKVMEDPEELSWIDLSFNNFIKIDQILLKYPNLKIIYLHGNEIDDITEVDKLACVDNLICLTLHGNPIENQAAYRHKILHMLPKLQTFDFSTVTKSDRKNAEVWHRNQIIKKTKKITDMDDD